MVDFLKHKLEVKDAKSFPGGTEHGSLNPANSAKKGNGPGVNSSLVGQNDGNGKLIVDAGKSGSGSKNQWAEISKKADSRELICDAGK